MSTSMRFGLLDTSISYGIPSYKSAAVQQAELAMLFSTGSQTAIRADIGYGPWLTGQVAVQDVIMGTVAEIKAAGRALILADAASETYRSAPLSWTRFQAAWALRVAKLAQLYQPDYYIVIKEPGWYVPMVKGARQSIAFADPADWLELEQALIKAVKAVSPKTQVGVSVAAYDVTAQKSFYEAFLGGSTADFIGFDIYGQAGQTATSAYLRANPLTKPLWIAECWSQTTPTSTAAEEQSDVTWLKGFYAYAQSVGCQMLIPFYTNLFSGYDVPAPTEQAWVDFFNGRTPVFTEFSSIVS